MKHFLLFLLSLCYVSNIWSTPRSELQARKMAEQFMQSHRTSTVRSPQALSLVATSHDLECTKKRAVNETQAAWYAYSYGEKAFVIISGDDRMTDVLGYSFDNRFCAEDMPDNLKMWLKAYSALAETSASATNVSASKANRMSYSSTDTPQEVRPLLNNIQYGQGDPYNRQCPVSNNQRCLTGCVATAMAGIMCYYRFPDKGTGYKVYTPENLWNVCSFDYANTPFDWDNILPSYSEEGFTTKQADAIANLMYACGVAAEMDYGTDASGAYDFLALSGLIKHLKYNPYMVYANREYYSSAEWIHMIRTSLAEGCPIYYSGTNSYNEGHAFVLDGYDRTGMVHINWGWDGSCNGYFDLLSLDYGLMQDGTGFSFYQSMLYGFKPNTYSSCTRVPQFFFENMEIEDDYIYVKDIYNHGDTFNGYFAIVAEKEGTVTPLGERKTIDNLSTNYGWQEIYLDLSYLDQLPAGRYKVYIASQARNDDRWMKANGLQTNNPYYYLTINNDGSHEWTSINSIYESPTAAVTLKSHTYNDLPFNFEITIHNPETGREFMAPIHLLVLDKKETELFQEIYCGHILLQPGQDTTLVCKATLQVESNGMYKFCPVWADMGYFYSLQENPIESEVKTGTVTNRGTISSCNVDKSIYEQGETISCAFTAKMAEGETADVFINQINILIVDKNYNVADGVTVDLFVERNKSVPYLIKRIANMPAGEYWIYYQTLYGSVLWKETVNVTEPTGTQAIKNESSGHPVYIPTSEASTICFDCNRRVTRVDVYNTSGLRIASTNSPQNIHDRYCITIPGLKKGNYLVNIHTDEKPYTLKICK